jgi:hypothetical protein
MNTVSKIYISEFLLVRSAELLASFTKVHPSEGVVYWFGFDQGKRSVVTTLMVPDADTSWGCVSTTPEANAEVLTSVVGTPLVLIGQAHSHPGRFVRHSDVDDRQTFPRFEGAISVVVPHFAKKGINLSQCGIHRFIAGRYCRIRRGSLTDHLEVLPAEKDFRK